MRRFELRKANRNTQAYMVYVGDCTLAVSYQTVVACAIPGEGWYKRGNCWGPTTRRHMTRDLYIPDDAREVDEEKMDEIVARAIMHAGIQIMNVRMGIDPSRVNEIRDEVVATCFPVVAEEVPA